MNSEKETRMDWKENLVSDPAEIAALLADVRRVAVIGMKTEEKSEQPAFYVPQYLHEAGLEVVPVPVYHPEAETILGQKVYRKLSDIPGDIDLVDIFRRPSDVMQHVDDIIAKKPKIVWMQSGIRNPEAAEKMARAGIKVVQDHCLMVEHARLARRR
jgi:predicted CoA-binding protein